MPEMLAKETEDRNFEEGFNALHGTSTHRSRNKSRFYHYESQFADYNETVLIFCFKDFARHREYNEQTFKLHHDLERRTRNRARREGDFDGGSAAAASEGYDAYALLPYSQRAAALEQGKQGLEAWLKLKEQQRGQANDSGAWLAKFPKKQQGGGGKTKTK